jgi:hypothetical protein
MISLGKCKKIDLQLGAGGLAKPFRDSPDGRSVVAAIIRLSET